MNNEDFERIGKRLFGEGLIGGNFGNISIRVEGGFLVTRNGCYLDKPGSPVYVPFEGEVSPVASTEYRVHRQVYRNTGHHAVVHAHPPHAVAASLVFDQIVPVDSEGELLCPRIPVVCGPCCSDVLAEYIADAMKISPLVLARGHGTFAAGCDLDQAYQLTALAEHSCQILRLLDLFPGDLGTSNIFRAD